MHIGLARCGGGWVKSILCQCQVQTFLVLLFGSERPWEGVGGGVGWASVRWSPARLVRSSAS